MRDQLNTVTTELFDALVVGLIKLKLETNEAEKTRVYTDPNDTFPYLADIDLYSQL